MKFKPWWKLSDKEKSERSYILAPFCILIIFVPFSPGYNGWFKFAFIAISILGFIIQGIRYDKKHKSKEP